MKTLFILAGVMVILFLAAPNKAEAQKRTAVKTLVGTISGFDCGDNCYLTITDKNGKEHVGLCMARPLCTKWNAATAMPDSYKGKRVRVTIGKGKQYNDAGQVMSTMDAFMRIQFLAEPQSVKSPTATNIPISFSGIYKSGNYGNLILKEIGTIYPKPFNFKIHLARNDCEGSIEGTANWINDNTASSKVKNDLYDANNKYDAPYCQLSFIFTGKKVLVKEESLYGCTNFHGVHGCEFDGEAFSKR